LQSSKKVGIVSYGAYIPRYRIAATEIAKVWGAEGEGMGGGLGVHSKSVPGPDEDVITISVEASRYAMARVRWLDPQRIGAVYVGSESHPYAVKPTATILAETVAASPDLTAADFEFACKAGTAAIQTCMGLVGSGMIEFGLAVGADTSQGAPGDALEYSASAGGAAFLIGAERPIATINHTYSFTTDTPDFWRREGAEYPTHAGRFSGQPSYFRHVTECANHLFAECGTKPTDYTYAVFHQPNGKFPTRAAQLLGFSKEQVKVGLLAPRIGNTYSGAVPVGLSAVLDVAKPGDRIFAIAYGSGAGSDGFDITVTDEISTYDRAAAPTIDQLLAHTENLTYATYAKFRGKVRLQG